MPDKKHKENFGRPPKFDTPEELELMIDSYFTDCPDKAKKYTSEGVEYEVECPTITGLAMYLGFCSRQSMYDYGKRDNFSYIIKKARLAVENTYESLLQMGSPTGAIFALKNMGWKDQTQVENTNIEKPEYDYSKLSIDELKQLKEIEEKAKQENNET